VRVQRSTAIPSRRKSKGSSQESTEAEEVTKHNERIKKTILNDVLVRNEPKEIQQLLIKANIRHFKEQAKQK